MLECARRLSGSQTRKQQTQLRLMQEQRGMIIYCLLLFQFIIHLSVCANVSLFSSYQVGRTSSLLMGNGAHAAVHGVGMVDLKLTLEKTV
jgi:hypothetical protein